MRRSILFLCLTLLSITAFAQPDPDIQAGWKKLVSALQRRCDLAPGALLVLSASKEVDKSLVMVADSLRKDFCSFLILNPVPDSLTVSKLVKMYDKLTHSFSAIFTSLERDPNFRDLSSTRQVFAHWEGIENRITVYRHDYNEICKAKGRPELQFTGPDLSPKIIF